MDTEQIINALKSERDRLDRAIAVLEGGSRESRGARGAAASAHGRRRRRHMSAEVKARIAAAQRRRWAKVKAQKKK